MTYLIMGILKGKGIEASDKEENQIIDNYKERHFPMKRYCRAC